MWRCGFSDRLSGKYARGGRVYSPAADEAPSFGDARLGCDFFEEVDVLPPKQRHPTCGSGSGDVGVVRARRDDCCGGDVVETAGGAGLAAAACACACMSMKWLRACARAISDAPSDAAMSSLRSTVGPPAATPGAVTPAVAAAFALTSAAGMLAVSLVRTAWTSAHAFAVLLRAGGVGNASVSDWCERLLRAGGVGVGAKVGL